MQKKKNQRVVKVWGTGKPLREFLYVDDFSKAVLKIINKYSDFEPINIGTGKEISIINLAKKISKLTGFTGKILFDGRYPDGTPRKVLNIKKIKKLGWKPITSLDKGIKNSINDYNREYLS